MARRGAFLPIYPRSSRAQAKGKAGEREVAAMFDRVDWGAIPNDIEDLGTDLFAVAQHRHFETET